MSSYRDFLQSKYRKLTSCCLQSFIDRVINRKDFRLLHSTQHTCVYHSTHVALIHYDCLSWVWEFQLFLSNANITILSRSGHTMLKLFKGMDHIQLTSLKLQQLRLFLYAAKNQPFYLIKIWCLETPEQIELRSFFKGTFSVLFLTRFSRTKDMLSVVVVLLKKISHYLKPPGQYESNLVHITCVCE